MYDYPSFVEKQDSIFRTLRRSNVYDTMVRLLSSTVLSIYTFFFFSPFPVAKYERQRRQVRAKCKKRNKARREVAESS